MGDSGGCNDWGGRDGQAGWGGYNNGDGLGGQVWLGWSGSQGGWSGRVE